MEIEIFENNVTYNQKEAAAKLRKSLSWFERNRWAGTGPRYLKVGRSVLYLGADLNSWLKAQARSSTSEGA